MSAEACARYPRAMQVAGQLLLLLRAVAHIGMPIDSDPTRPLPFSQLSGEGFMAYQLRDFIYCFF